MSLEELLEPELLQTDAGQVILRLPQSTDRAKLINLRREGLALHPNHFGMSADLPDEKFQEWANNWLDPMIAQFFPVVCEFDKNIVGMGCIRRNNSPKTSHSATINAVYLSPEWRGKGIMQRIFLRLEAWAIFYNLHHIKLGVTTTNEAAIKMYKKAGFEIYAMDPYSLNVDGNLWNEYLMIKVLKP